MQLTEYVRSGHNAWRVVQPVPELEQQGWTVTSRPQVYVRYLSFDGTDDGIRRPFYGAIKSVVVRCRIATTTEKIIDFNGGTTEIEAISGTVTAGGFTSPTIYVNGSVSSTIAASAWAIIAVTSATAISPSFIRLGNDGTTFGEVDISHVLVSGNTLTATEISDITNDLNRA